MKAEEREHASPKRPRPTEARRVEVHVDADYFRSTPERRDRLISLIADLIALGEESEAQDKSST